MEWDKTEELQRSIDAVLARIEAQKLALGSLFRDTGPHLVFGTERPPVPTLSGVLRLGDRFTRAARLRR